MNQSPLTVLAVYRVAEKSQSDFFRILLEKRAYFLKANFVTARDPVLLRSNTNPEFLIDVFEWASEDAIERAHIGPVVMRLWSAMEDLWIDGGLGLGQLPESDEAFAGFQTIVI